MSMVLSMVRRAVVICLVSGALASCTSEPSPNELDRTEAAESGAMSDERVHQPPTSLRVVNHTSQVVVLTSADGQSTASIGPGESLQLASKRVCKWIPLTASTTNGRFVDKFTKPCSGQTWTITDLAQPTKTTQCSMVRLPDGGLGEADFYVDKARGLLDINFSDMRQGQYRNVSYTVRYRDDRSCATDPQIAEVIERVFPRR